MSESQPLPKGYFSPRKLLNRRLVDWRGEAPSTPTVIIQSAIRGGPTFEPAKKWELEQLSAVAPDVSGVHSYAGPEAPSQIINQEMERQSVPHILANIKQAAESGWRGVVINDCMADPGLQEVRHLVAEIQAPLEIIGPAETSLKAIADEVGNFAIVGVGDAVPIFQRLAERYGLKDQLTGIYIDSNLEPQNLHRLGLDEVARNLNTQIRIARKEGANGIVFGCTTLGGVLAELRKQQPDLTGYPLVEPMPVTLATGANRVRQMRSTEA
jgi:Asp/Glu/hydantoin racemase